MDEKELGVGDARSVDVKGIVISFQSGPSYGKDQGASFRGGGVSKKRKEGRTEPSVIKYEVPC